MKERLDTEDVAWVLFGLPPRRVVRSKAEGRGERAFAALLLPETLPN